MRKTNAEALRELERKRADDGVCRHCGGPLPCWSPFGDASRGRMHPKPPALLAREASEARARERAWARDLARRTRWGVFRWTPELRTVPNHVLPARQCAPKCFRSEQAAQNWIAKNLARPNLYVVRFWILDPTDDPEGI